MTFLDTNFLVFALSRGTVEDQKLRSLFLSNDTVGVSVIAWAEFLCGPVTAEHVKLATNNVADFQRFAPWGLSLLVP
jgi:predicted nucleic acid-binding protein